MPERVIGRAEESETVRVVVGESVLVRLEENPTTGYLWEVEAVDSRLSLEDVEFESRSGAIGAGGLRTFRVRGEEPGSAHLRLVLRRPWEGAVPPEDTCEFVFEVKAPDCSRDSSGDPSPDPSGGPSGDPSPDLSRHRRSQEE